MPVGRLAWSFRQDTPDLGGCVRGWQAGLWVVFVSGPAFERASCVPAGSPFASEGDTSVLEGDTFAPEWNTSVLEDDTIASEWNTSALEDDTFASEWNTFAPDDA